MAENQPTLQFAQPDQTNWGGDQSVPRDRYGRPLITPPGGGDPIAYTRATTFVDALSDSSNLTSWKLRLAGIGLANRDDLLLQVAQTDPKDTRALNQLMQTVLDAAGANSKAQIGTQIHEATEKLDRRENVGPLGKYQADLDAYATATAGIEWTGIESFRVQDELQVGGTADRIGKMGNQLFIADIKTGGLYDVGRFAAQLALYARGVPYDTATGQRGDDPLPMNLDQGLLIHLPAGEGRADLYWLNLQAGWEAAQLAAKVRSWRQFHKNKATRDQVIVPVRPEEAAAMGGAR